MNWLYFILFFLLSGYNYSSANGTFHPSFGPTVSYFLDAENAKPKIGITFGFNGDFHLYKKYSLSAYESSTRIKKILGFTFGYNNGTSPRLWIFFHPGGKLKNTN